MMDKAGGGVEAHPSCFSFPAMEQRNLEPGYFTILEMAYRGMIFVSGSFPKFSREVRMPINLHRTMFWQILSEKFGGED